MHPQGANIDPKATLVTTRVIWAAMVMGTGTMATVFAFLTLRSGEGAAAGGELGTIFLATSFALTGLVVPAGLFTRGQVFKSGWVGDVVRPLHYQAGNIIAWGCCEGAALFGIVACYLMKSFWPYALPPAAAFVVLLLLWPNGRAMFPTRDPYATTRA